MRAQQQASSTGATLGLAVLFGALAASIEPGIGGFVLGALLGALLAQVLYLRSRAQAVDAELEALRQALQSQAPEPPPRSSTIDRDAGVAPGVAPAPRGARAPASPVRRMAEYLPAQATLAAEAEWTAAPAAAEDTGNLSRAGAQLMVWLKRGNPLARIGIVILFFGAAFLAKYAADNSLFPIELRFIAIAAGALALLAIGWRLRERRTVYAQLLQGGGIAGLYLTVFAATRLYQLLPLGLAFALMVGIALAAAIIAVAQSSLSLAVIGTAGGFLAPILVSTGSGNHVALFSYYALLNVGIFAVAWFKVWRVLNVLGFVGTFAITGLWRVTSYQPADLLSADLFLILFFLMYVAVSILNSVRQPPNLRGYVSGALVFGLPVVAFTLHATMVSRIEYALAYSAFALGALYLLLGWALLRGGRERFRLLVEAFAALGVIFASLAIPLAFDTRTTAAMWAVEGAGLVWLGVRQQRKLARAFGALLQAGAAAGYLLGLQQLQGDQPVLNSAYLGTVMLAVAGICSGCWLYRNEAQQAHYESGAHLAFTLWGVAWWLFGGLYEIGRHALAAGLGAGLGYAGITAVVLAIAGSKLSWPPARRIALFLPALAAPVAFAYALSLGHPLADWGAVGWLILSSVHFALLRNAESEPVTALDWLHAGACWALALLFAWEGSWQVAQQTAGVWAGLPWGLVPALLLAWLGRRHLLPHWPLAVRVESYRLYAAPPLALAVCAWIVIINLSSSGDAAWLPYFPLLNPLDVCVTISLAALALWWSALEPPQRARVWRLDQRALIASAAGLVFLWLNAALIRALHHNWGAPITPYGIARSTLIQASLSILWGVLGFATMTVAARKHWRHAWLVGAVLMIVVVVKLFLVDLSSVGTVARIASFLTVGVLLLITGYLAPLPPKKDTL